MFEMVRKAKKNQKGFTLVELMVVVVIIGVLIAIAVPIFNAVTARAEAGACMANQRIMDGAVMMWSTEEGATGSPTDVQLGAYLQDGIPLCPTNDVAYGIQAPGTPHVCPSTILTHAR